MLTAFLPAGKLWRLVGTSLLSPLLLGSADELARLDARGGLLVQESLPINADELLPEYERELDIVASGTDSERRAKVAARYIARQRYRPVDFQTALAPILGLAAASIIVIETSRALAIAVGDGREIYRFFIYRNPALSGSYDIAAAQVLVDDIKPSHTLGHVITSISFLCDDPFSLCDRDLLGA